MSISGAFQNALSGLTATSRLASTTSDNLANALTPGFGRREVVLSARVIGTQGGGVTVAETRRATDPGLTESRRAADGEFAGSTLRRETLNAIEGLFGRVGTADGLAERYGAFEDGLRNLAETPESGPRQDTAARNARDLAGGIRTAADGLAALRTDTEREITRTIDSLNADLGEVALLNRRIQLAKATGRETAPLVDQRDMAIDRISAEIPTRLSQRDDGTVELWTREGVPLAHIRAREVAFDGMPFVTPQQSYDPTGGGALSGLSVDGIDITPSGTGPQRVAGGRMAALFEMRDTVLPEAQARLDSLAADLVERFQTPTLAPSGVGLFTDNGGAYDAADLVGLSGRIRLNDAVDPAAGGEARRLRDGLASTSTGPLASDTTVRAFLDAATARTDGATTPGLSGSLDLAGRFAGLAELAATARVSAEARSAALGAAREAVATEEAERIGVDQDVELQTLIQLQQAYQANIQVIQAAEAMLNSLSEI